MKEIQSIEKSSPLIAVTGANFQQVDGDMSALVKKMHIDKKPLLLLFGTGWGLTASLYERADFRLESIAGLAEDAYNHLSVRSAVAIYCDRFAEASGV